MHIPCSQYHIIKLPFFIHFRIPYVAAHVIRIISVIHHQLLGRKMIPILAGKMNGVAHPAAHDIIVIIPVKQLHITCVKIVDGFVLHIS